MIIKTILDIIISLTVLILLSDSERLTKFDKKLRSLK